MILLVRPKWLRKNFNGMTLWPFVVVKHQTLCEDKIFLNHESIHLQQQLEMIIIFFYLWYGLEFLVRWAKCGNKNQAYRNISFEQEAYMQERNFLYLKQRTFWAFLKYV